MKLWVIVANQFKNCASQNITLNRPKQKENDQFMGVDVATNFDTAATRIHVERFIDILSSTWQTLAHICNFTNWPIGPKE